MEEQGPGEIWGELPTAEAPAATIAIDERGEDIVDFVFHAQNRAEDIALVRDMGFEVDARLDVQWTNVCTRVVPEREVVS